MRTFSWLGKLASVLAASTLCVASAAAFTPEEANTARRQWDETLAALDAANGELAGIEERLGKIKSELDVEYRVADDHTRRGSHEEESKSRAAIRELKSERDDLWVARDRAKLVVSQRQAEAESAEALFQIHDLESSESADSSLIKQWRKKHERALARARRLQRELETAGWPDQEVP